MKFTISFLITLLSVAFFLQGAKEATAQQFTGETFATEFRDHVVTIRTKWANGTQQEGFGFVVGQNSTGIYIVTANHVVRGKMPGEVAEIVELTWFRRRGEKFLATLIGTSSVDRDIAVLRTTAPIGLELKPDLMVYAPGRVQRGAPAWFIGRAGDWYVPSQPGTINSVDLNEQILVDGLNIQVGTSGAPLITEEGVAGIIIEDAGGVVRATSIGFIARAFDLWAHPWGMTQAQKNAPPEPDVKSPGTVDEPKTKTWTGGLWFVFFGSFPHVSYAEALKLQHDMQRQVNDQINIIDTDKFSNLTNGLYSVVISAATRDQAEAIKRRVVHLKGDAYVKSSGSYYGD